MANYQEKERTNYFKVKDEAEFRAWAESHNFEIGVDTEGRFCVFPYNDDFPTEIPLIAAGGSQYEDETQVFDIIAELMKFIADDSIGVVLSVGSEKHKYMAGFAVAFNSKGEYLTISLEDIYKQAEDKWGIPVTHAVGF